MLEPETLLASLCIDPLYKWEQSTGKTSGFHIRYMDTARHVIMIYYPHRNLLDLTIYTDSYYQHHGEFIKNAKTVALLNGINFREIPLDGLQTT